MSGALRSTFRERLRGGETVVGSFVNLGSALATEIMGIAGLDWLVLDLEHGAGDEGALLAQLHALSAGGTATLVRVEAIDLPRFMHALDLGADGVLVPRLRTVEDAKLCVEYSRYAGLRGVARYNRSFHWGSASRSLAEIDTETVCAVQIETARGPPGRRRDRGRRGGRHPLRRAGRSRAFPRPRLPCRRARADGGGCGGRGCRPGERQGRRSSRRERAPGRALSRGGLPLPRLQLRRGLAHGRRRPAR